MTEEETLSPLSFTAARSGAIALQQKFTKSTGRRECPSVFVILDFVKPPKISKGPIRLKLPHPVRLFPFQSAVVFVGGEGQKWQDVFDKTDLKLKAISMSNLAKHYSKQKEQDELFVSADYFFVEKNVADQLPKRLGNKFFSRNRQPTLVTLDIANPEQIAQEIKDAVEQTDFRIRPTDNCWIRVGCFNLSFDNMAENITTACELAYHEIPKAKPRIKSIRLYTSGIEMPPIWDKHKKEVDLDTPITGVIKKNKKKRGKDESDEDEE
jgi:hypothetical protein